MTTTVATPLVMWPAAQIAARDGVTREAVLKLVREFVEQHGLQVTRDARGRIATIDVAAYDHLRGRYGDPARNQTRPPESPPGPRDADSLDEAQRQGAWLTAAKRRLEVAELSGALIRRDRYVEAVARSGEEIVRVLDLLPQEADTIAAELGLDEVHPLRLALKGTARRLRGRIARLLEEMADAAPNQDDELKDGEEAV